MKEAAHPKGTTSRLLWAAGCPAGAQPHAGHGPCPGPPALLLPRGPGGQLHVESLLRSTVSEKELMSSSHLTNGLAGYRILVLKFLYFNTENFLINPLLLFRSLILISFLLLCNFFFRKDLEFTPLLLKSTVMSVVTGLWSVLCLAFFVSKTLPCL